MSIIDLLAFPKYWSNLFGGVSSLVTKTTPSIHGSGYFPKPLTLKRDAELPRIRATLFAVKLYLCLLLPLWRRKRQKMLWSIFQHWPGEETSALYHYICADSVQSATKQEDKPAMGGVRKVCYHIDYDLRKGEKRERVIRYRKHVFTLHIILASTDNV